MANIKRFPCRMHGGGRFLGYLDAEDMGTIALVVLPKALPDPPFEKELAYGPEGPLVLAVRQWLEGEEEVRTLVVPDEETVRLLTALLTY